MDILFIGSNTIRDAVLDTGGDSSARETGDRARFCFASMHDYGENSEIWRGCENGCKTCRGGREEERTPGETSR